MSEISDFRASIRAFEFASPEFRLELMDGQFIVGGSLMGSRWLLREILRGWGLVSGIAFAPLERWYAALEVAFGSDWATNTSDQVLELPPLGSQYLDQHWRVRRRLKEDLLMATSLASLGQCIGSDFVMHLGGDAFTPDLMLMRAERLEQHHDWFFDGAADLVIEVLLPEHSDLDRVTRFQKYEAGGVQHYWIFDPVQQQFEPFQLTASGYQPGTLDPDGCYRQFEGLTFVPAHLWLPYAEKLPTFEAPYQASDWVIREVEGEDLTWGTLPFQPQVELNPVLMQFEQFLSWCPEAKFEGYGGDYPIIGGRLGTHNALGMLLMSLGLIETVKLMPPQDWVMALRQAEEFYAADSEHRQRAWQFARGVAQELHQQHHVGGVGVIGDLVHPETPWNFWSKISFVLWDVPEDLEQRRLWQDFNEEFEVHWIMPPYCIPAEWQQILTEMEVLVGSWEPERYQPVRKRLQKFDLLEE